MAASLSVVTPELSPHPGVGLFDASRPTVVPDTLTDGGIGLNPLRCSSVPIHEAAVAINRSIPDVLRTRSSALFVEGKYELALAEAFEYTKIKPECIHGYISCGKCLVKLNRFEEALNAYRKGLEIDPNHKIIVTDLKNMQEHILTERERRADAGEADYNALKFCSQDAYPGDDELLALEEEILSKKRLDDVPELGEPPLRLTAARAELVVKEARAQRTSGDLDAALDSYTSVLQSNPNNFELWKEKSEILFQKGLFKEAIQCCNVIIPPLRSSDVWKLGGMILRDLEFPVSAEAWLRKASKLCKNANDEAAILFQQVRTQRLYGPLIGRYPIRVDFSKYGRTVRAAESIKQGNILFGDAPLVLAQTLDSLKTPACSFCAKNLLRPEDYFEEGVIEKDPILKKAIQSFWPQVQKRTCPHCAREAYCSKDCEKNAWERHHQLLCPAKNKASAKLYEVCDQYTGSVSGAMGTWAGVWNASFSPMVLARIWASIISESKKQAKAAGLSKPSSEQWSLAMAPYRRFIAYGSSSNAKVIPKMHQIMIDVFKDCGDGVTYEISQREFDGRYFQATCNVQAFSDPNPPLKIFVEKTNSTPFGNYIMEKLTNGQPEAVFAGMFPLHACINHSCDNNVEIMDGIVEGAVGVKVRAKRPIGKEEEIFTTYIDTSLPRKERRSWLHRAYNFWCTCDRCQFEGDGPGTCTNCGVKAEPGKKLPTCGKCHRAWYCTPKCQKQSWKKGHKRICSMGHSKTASPSDDLIRSIMGLNTE